ncbi:MAG: aspartate 1-decarboxylase [bacterium]
MYRHMCKSKIHRARVTGADPDYVGSVTISEDLMEAADILPYERVQVVDVTNGARIETYAIAAPRGSGGLCLNGAAARLIHKNDTVIIISYCMLNESELKNFRPKIIFVDGENRVLRTEDLERPYETVPRGFPRDVC